MLLTLLVEDQRDKAVAVRTALEDVPGFDSEWLQTVSTVSGARAALRQKHYDLVVLDIALPFTEDGEVTADAGVQLVEELVSRPDRYNMPGHIIGLTGYQDVYDRTAGRFASWLLSLDYYDVSSTEWRRRLRARVGMLLAARREQAKYGCDCLVLCALQRPELSAVLRIPWSWREWPSPGDHSIYWQGTYDVGRGPRTVYAGAAARVGPTAAASLTTKAVMTFRPKLVVMAGIMAGVRDKTRHGDAIAAEPCWDWGSGKWVQVDGEKLFQPAPHQVGCDGWVREKVQLLVGDEGLLQAAHVSYLGAKPPESPRLLLGPVASGASVLADGGTIHALLSQHRQLLGVEMEAYGVYAAAEEVPEPRPHALVLKSVVDYADGDKSDTYQAYAAHISAVLVQAFVERFV